MKIVWSTPALDDLDDVRAWIGRENPQLARTVAGRILEAIDALE